ncbi:MAG: hypothetical protein PHU91_00930 [Candidatus Omnitrophica bacterium]|nr:hypothetical protein [Candidatus Omnitrophota bacterium]
MKKGVTLVELLVASLLTALILGTLAYIFTAGRRYILYSRSRAQAMELGKGVADSLSSDVNPSGWGNLTFGANKVGPSETLNTITYISRYNVSDMSTQTGSPETRKVTMSINWSEPVH